MMVNIKREVNFVQELEMSKNRNQKVLITDEAINKVPCIRYKEIPEYEDVIFQKLAKEVLSISKNENDSNEVALTYSLDHENLIATGKEYIGISLGDEHSVDPCMNTVSNHLIKVSSTNTKHFVKIAFFII